MQSDWQWLAFKSVWAGWRLWCVVSAFMYLKKSGDRPSSMWPYRLVITVGFRNFIADFWDESLARWNFDSVPPIGGTQSNFQPWKRDSGIETLARVPGARPFPSARPLSAEWLFSQCLFHYILVCYHMLFCILLYCTIFQYVVRSILCPTHAFFYFMSCYISLRKFWLLCYVMVSILLCFALFGYVLLYVISLVRLYYVMLLYIILYSLLRRNPL